MAAQALRDVVPGASPIFYESQTSMYNALKDGEIDIALEDVYQSEYSLRKEAWKEELAVAGDSFWNIDVAIAVSRPDSMEHPAYR